MAIVKIISSGNWSNPAIFSTGIPPTSSDDVICNGFISTCDITITINSLRNDTTGSSTIGGGVVFSSGGLTLTTGSLVSAAINLITFNHNTGLNVLNVTNSLLTPFNNTIVIVGSGNVNILCPEIRQSTSGTIIKNGNGLLNLTGNLYNNLANSSSVLNITSGIVVVNGNITGGPNNGGWTTVGVSLESATLTVNGNIYGRGLNNNSNGRTDGVYMISGFITVNGNVYGGNTTLGTSSAITCLAGDITINGITTGGNGALGYAIYSTSSGTITLNGRTKASSTSPAVLSTNPVGSVIASGPMENENRFIAIQTYKLYLTPLSTSWLFQKEGTGNKTLYTDNQLAINPQNGLPIVSDVKSGVVYGLNGTLIGTLNLPEPNYVRGGVPVGSTVGSAVPNSFTAQDLFNAISGSTSGVGKRLKNIATVETVGAQLSGFNN